MAVPSQAVESLKLYVDGELFTQESSRDESWRTVEAAVQPMYWKVIRPSYRWHLGCILPRVPATIIVRTGRQHHVHAGLQVLVRLGPGTHHAVLSASAPSPCV